MRQGWTRFRLRHPANPVLLGLALLAIGADPGRAEDWSLPDSRLGIRTAPILLLSRADIQNDLALSTEQVLSAQRAIHDLHSRAAALKGQPDADVIASRRSIDEAQQRWLDNQLNDQQRARLFQIDLQWEGPSAVISRPWLANQLGLSEQQRQALAQAVARRSPSSGGSRTTQAHQHPDERALAEEVLTILSAEQRERWKQLLGEPITFQSAR